MFLFLAGLVLVGVAFGLNVYFDFTKRSQWSKRFFMIYVLLSGFSGAMSPKTSLLGSVVWSISGVLVASFLGGFIGWMASRSWQVNGTSNGNVKTEESKDTTPHW